MTLKEEVFSKVIGLYIMKKDIPPDLIDFVRSNECPSEDTDVKMIFTMLLGSTDSKSVELRQMIKPLI